MVFDGRVSNHQIEDNARNLCKCKRTVRTNVKVRKKKRSTATDVPVKQRMSVRDSIRKSGKDLKMTDDGKGHKGP